MYNLFVGILWSWG